MLISFVNYLEELLISFDEGLPNSPSIFKLIRNLIQKFRWGLLWTPFLILMLLNLQAQGQLKQLSYNFTYLLMFY